MTRPEDLHYPVLCFGRDDSVSIARSAAELRSCNSVAWFRNRYFDELRLFDAFATPYRVRSARLAAPLAGWRGLLARALNSRLVADLELEPLGQASLAEAKATAIRWLHRRPEFWEASDDLAQWERRVSEAASMDALCAVLA